MYIYITRETGGREREHHGVWPEAFVVGVDAHSRKRRLRCALLAGRPAQDGATLHNKCGAYLLEINQILVLIRHLNIRY